MFAFGLLLAGIACLLLHGWCEMNCTRLDVETGRRDPGALFDDYGSNRGWYWQWKLPSIAGGIGALVFLLWAFHAVMSGPARAHDHQRADLTPWFKSLQSRRGASCCDGSDATHLDGSDWEAAGNRYRVRINGQWIDVPESAVVDGPNKAGDAMVWLNTGYSPGIRCFMPGSMT